ncbi:MAG: hypothetical protein LBS67_07555 [Clostridiales Family XIII bacterium]|jgi:hypothetical protein|nr:hypothetical protein [Clostridiales Family XIII bacterium]
MTVFRFELKKLLLTKAVWAFVAVALAVNIGFVAGTSEKAVIDYINEVAAVAGTEFGASYREKLAALPVPDDPDLKEIHQGLIAGAEGYFDSFDGLSTDELWLSKSARISGVPRALLERKYEMLSPVIARKSTEGDAASVYFSVYTNEIHQIAFVYMIRVIMAEVGALALLLMLMALRYESLSGTVDTVWAKRIGRLLALPKMLAALAALALLFALIYGVSYSVLFGVNDFSSVWDLNVSALYHNFPTFDGFIPFVTWTSMTVKEYFLGMTLVCFLNCAVFAFFVAPLALLCRNVLLAFGSAAAIIFLNLVSLIKVPDASILYYALLAPPLGQALQAGRWFSEGAGFALIPHFETVYPLICIGASVALIIPAYRRFHGKDLLA